MVLKPLSRCWLSIRSSACCNSTYRSRYWNNWLATLFPLFDVFATVLTVYGIETRGLSLERDGDNFALQQCLPFTVLKHCYMCLEWSPRKCCNSTYRLRYAPKSARQQRSKATMKSAHRKYLNEEKVKWRWSSNSTYRLRYWNRFLVVGFQFVPLRVATAPTVYGMRRRVRDSRGAKRRWGPHIASTWTKRR